jgi:outer membrane immunogenic protein
MKKLFPSVIALAALAVGPAIAADMPVKAPLYKAPVVLFSWTGCYIGGNAGWKWGRFRESADTAPFTVPNFVAPPVTFPGDHIDLDGLNTSSWAVGGQVGCRYETLDHWVIGFEGDFDAMKLQGTVLNPRPATIPGTRGVFTTTDTFGNRARWESSLRLTAGHSFDRLLVYVTGGVAFTSVTMDGNFGPTGIFPGSFGSDSKTLVGGTVGAGVNYALTNNVDIGALYRYSSYESKDFNLGTVPGSCAFLTQGLTCTNTTVTGHKRLETSEILFQLNYRFGGGPVVARY